MAPSTEHSVASASEVMDEARRRRIRRNALLLALVAGMFYLGFILMAVRSGHV